jgi:hypothetical protein
MPRREGADASSMGEDFVMSEAQIKMDDLVAEVSKAMCFGRIRNSSAFVATSVTYPNGVGTIARIDPVGGRFIVSDDGHATAIAETMGAGAILRRIAPSLARRSGVSFERDAFLLTDVERISLPASTALIANTSARAMERVVFSLEQPKIRRSRDLFDKRLRAAFGDNVTFNLEFRGATGRDWEFDAGVERDGSIVRLYELVSPTTQAVAMANMKISDTRALANPPIVTAALADYEATEPALRAILSAAGGVVIAANDDVARYRLSAA